MGEGNRNSSITEIVAGQFQKPSTAGNRNSSMIASVSSLLLSPRFPPHIASPPLSSIALCQWRKVKAASGPSRAPSMVCSRLVRSETLLLERTFSPLVELHVVCRNCVVPLTKRELSPSGLHVCCEPIPHRSGLICAMNWYFIVLLELTCINTCLDLYFTVTGLPHRRVYKHSLINTRVLSLIVLTV